jgi:ubiquinone/menaquinone biosynthesis C-methylase UbiE
MLNNFHCVMARWTQFSLTLLEHLENPDKCVQELYRVLKQGAAAIIQLPNLQYLFEPHTKLPLLGFMPKRVQSRIVKMIEYAYINFDVTVKKCFIDASEVRL